MSSKAQFSKSNLNTVLLIANGKVTAKNKTDFPSLLSKLKEDEQKNVCFCLILNYKNAISNMALTKILKMNDIQQTDNIFTKIPENDLNNFVNFFPTIFNFNTKYFQKIILKFSKLVPENKIEFLVNKLKEQNLLFLYKEVYTNLIKRKPSIMLDFILNFDQTNNVQHKIFNSILCHLDSPHFSPEIISEISLLFLCQKLKFDSKEFSSFCFYISNKYPLFPFEIQNNFAQEIGTIALSLYNYIFTTIPMCRDICVKILTDKMKKEALKQNEAIVMIHTLEDEDLIDVVISSIIYKGPFSVLTHISARAKEKQKYQELYNILFPSCICLMKLTDKNSQVVIKEMENLTQFMYVPFVLNKLLDEKRKDIIISYSKYNNTAFVLTHILKICESAKKSLLQPITVSFQNNPGDSFTALYLLANSRYITDIMLFRRVVRAIVRSCIPPNFKELVENYNFPTRIKKFIQSKYEDVESTHKFLLKVYSHKSSLVLKDERVLRHLKNLKIHEDPVQTQSVPSTPVKDKNDSSQAKIPQSERKPPRPPITSKDGNYSENSQQGSISTQESPEKTEQQEEAKPPTAKLEKKKSWSIFGFISNHFISSGNAVSDEEPTLEPPEPAQKEEKKESDSKGESKESKATNEIVRKPPKPTTKVQTSKYPVPQKPQVPTRRTSTIISAPLKINSNRTNSEAKFATPPLDAPSDDSISLDQELDELPEDYSESTSYSDSEPLDDLNDVWAR